jgi:hypothetical protein
MDGLSMNETPTEAEAQDTGEEDLKGLKSDEELVERAKECYRAGFDASAKWRDDALEDLNFLAGEQWDPAVKGGRDAAGRPALTVNRLPQFVRQVTNEQRQSKPAVTVSPVDDGSDKKTAEVLQGIIRNVEYTSNADAAYAAGGQSAAVTGLGYWDVGAEYEDEKSFDQRLVIRRIGNPLSVVMDPGAKEMAGDDARWCVISTDISVGEWEANFPDKEMPTSKGWDGRGDSAASWVGKEGVRIHEYRYITEEPDTLLEVPEPILRVPPGMFMDMPHGGVALASELEPQVAQLLAQSGGDATPEGAQNGGAVLASELEPDVAKLLKSRRDINQRPTLRRTARWAKIAGDEVIEKGRVRRPLPPAGARGGHRARDRRRNHLRGHRPAREGHAADAQLLRLCRGGGHRPHPQGALHRHREAVRGLEDIWRTANSRTHSYLPYNPVPDAPPPQRVMAEANVSAITNARMQAADDLKAVTGIYDAAGRTQQRESGRAILARQSQGQTANFHFQDNLAMAIRYTGRILIDLIPKIYSGPKTLRILGEDGSTRWCPSTSLGSTRARTSTLRWMQAATTWPCRWGPATSPDAKKPPPRCSSS